MYLNWNVIHRIAVIVLKPQCVKYAADFVGCHYCFHYAYQEKQSATDYILINLCITKKQQPGLATR